MSKDTPITAEQEAEARYPVRAGNWTTDHERRAFEYGTDWQALKDKQRIEELKKFVKSIIEMKDETGESSYDQMKAGYAMGYNKCLGRIKDDAEQLLTKP